MSLRSFADQLHAEEAARDAFLASLGPAAGRFERLTSEQVRDAIACPKHGGRLIGQFCGATESGPFVCLDRRIAAARQAVEAG